MNPFAIRVLVRLGLAAVCMSNLVLLVLWPRAWEPWVVLGTLAAILALAWWAHVDRKRGL